MGLKVKLAGIDLEKFKAEKALKACKCKIEGCERIGKWQNNDFYLPNGMCNMHFKKFKKYGDPLAGRLAKDFKDGRTSHPLYKTWNHIRDRITNEKCKTYPYYGGRGLKMEESWIIYITGFWQFVSDIAYLGKRPDGHTLDRKDNEIGYLIGNLRWSNAHQQSANTRSNNETVGVGFDKHSNRWWARLNVNKVRVLDKSFATEAEAIEARKDAEVKFRIIY